MGKLQSKLYIIKGRLFRGSNEEFIEAFFDLHDLSEENKCLFLC